MSRPIDISNKGWTIPDISAGDTGKILSVNGGETGYEYAPAPTSGSGVIGGARVYGSAGTIGADSYLNFPSVNFDPDSLFTFANGRMTVPAGVSKVRCMGQIRFLAMASPSNNFGVNYGQLQIRKNGALMTNGGTRCSQDTGGRDDAYFVDTSIVDVTPGDYFNMYYDFLGGSTRTYDSSHCWFAMEIIE